jgi:hypothetical protein
VHLVQGEGFQDHHVEGALEEISLVIELVIHLIPGHISPIDDL